MGTQELRSDGDLLRAVADRDRAALRELYDRHAPWLRARLARRCGDEGVVEEVVQDTPRSLSVEEVLDRALVFRPAGQAALLAVAVLALVVAVTRRTTFEDRSRA